MPSTQKSKQNSFHATINEIEAQKADIPNYISYLRSTQIEPATPEEAVFCGAGDSLAAAMFVERLMNFKPRSFDPYDMILFPEVASRKKVFFISVSGRTRSNIRAALAVNKTAKKTIAITANEDSELARICDNSIRLDFSKTIDELTPGTTSFNASLLACCSIFKKPENLDAESIVERGRKWGIENAKSMYRSEAIHFVGSGPFYAIALYGAAKIFEFSGGRADYQMTEEFSHMNLFSTKRRDSVLILGHEKGEDDLARNLSATLSESGIRSVLMPDREKETTLSRAISFSIHLQYLSLYIAINRGFSKPAFLENRKLLEISDRMIY